MTVAKLNELPAPIRERLIDRFQGSDDVLVFHITSLFRRYVLIAVSLTWLILLALLTNNYLWHKALLVIFSAVTVVAVFLLIDNGVFLIRWFTSAFRPRVLITPNFVIDVDFDTIKFWDLDELDSINIKHQDLGGSYRSSQLILVLNDETKTIGFNDREIAETAYDRITDFRKLFIEAVHRNDREYLDRYDDLRGLDIPADVPQTSGYGKFAARIVTFGAALIIATPIVFGAATLNGYFDDLKSWNVAQSAGRASDFRVYLQTHPNGRWSGDGNQRLQSLYDDAEQKYRASLNVKYDHEAADAVSEMLKYAKSTQNYRVKVSFERNINISGTLEDEVKKEFNVKHVLPLGDALSEEKMAAREGRLLSLVSDALKEVIPDDILEFSGDCSGTCMGLSVKYEIDPKYSVYYDLRQKDVPENDRTWYPGILIDWHFGVQIPEQPQTYHFDLDSIPDEDISYDSNSNEKYDAQKNFADVLNLSKDSMYDSMVASAFDDFRATLIYRLGIGKAPKSMEGILLDPEPAPAPQKTKPKKGK